MNAFMCRRTSKAMRLVTVILLLIALLSNSMIFAYAAEGNITFTIGGTTFTVMPGSETPVTAFGDDGSVEIATAEGAVIWANLGGAGAGSLTENMITWSEAVTHTLSDNVLTIGDYAITVRDNSASGKPVADGVTRTYDFTDGSVVSTLYTSGNPLDQRTITSSDQLLTLTGSNLYVHTDPRHGITFSYSAEIKIHVAGDAKIDLTLCSSSAGSFQVSNKDGTFSTTVNTNGDSDGAVATVEYKGEETTLTFTYNTPTRCYLHGISVTNEAEQTDVTQQTAMPAAVNLTATPTGQRLTLSQTGGSFATGSPLSDTVGYYGFPATDGIYTLEADVTVTECDNSSAHGVFLGAFDTQATPKMVAVAGIRGNTNLRGIAVNDSGNLSATQIDATIEAGQTIHIKADKTAEDLWVTMTTEDGTDYTATLNYTNSDSCQLGLILANATATVTNMVYTRGNSKVLYDQNLCYSAVGQAPEITSVQANLSETREAIVVSWTVNQQASGDGVALVEVSTDGTTWTEIARTSATSYTYAIDQSGNYQFRVTGYLGATSVGPTRTINPQYFQRALYTPVVEATASANSVSLSWDAVTEAASYDIYRFYDDTAAQCIATTTEPAYTDTDILAEAPYYYYVIARSADNWSNPSATVWAMPSAGHEGAYLPAEQGARFTLTEGTDETVFSDALTIAGTVDQAGVVRAYLNGVQLGEDQTVAANGAFSYAATLTEGSNTVTLILTDENGDWSRAVYNYRYLPTTSINMIVDAAYTGTDGAVDANGIPTYHTVQAAVDNAAAGNVTIFVRAGDYEERLVVNAPNITLIGEGDDTFIHCYPADLYENPDPTKPGYEAGGDMALRCATYIQSTATNFHAENIRFANDYVYGSTDSSNQSADALRCDADGASFVNVTFSGVQDTLYMDAGVQTYTNCRIEGSVDFIYSGDAAQALFNDCEIVYINAPGRTTGVICAPRTAADDDCGLVFYRCSIIAEDGCPTGSLSLARPWGADAAVYWIDCYMSDAVDKDETYQEMSGNDPANARFYECGSYGPGYGVNTSRRQISPSQAQMLLTTYFGITRSAPLEGAPLNTETPDTPSGGGSSSGSSGSSSSNRPDASVTGEGGSVSASSNGTVTITPDEGYQIASITVNGEEVAIPSNGVLTGLDQNDEVIVTFEPIPQGTTEEPFDDVSDSAWYADAVQYVYENGIMNGVTATEFGPNMTTNRAMIVTMLYRLEGEPAAETAGFTDVATGVYYVDAVAWAQANNIVNGITETTFAPSNNISREQLATILYRYAQYKGCDVSVGGMSLNEYTDASQISAYATTAMQWANENGLITGVTNTTLEPQGSATRAQVATILMRFVESIAK